MGFLQKILALFNPNRMQIPELLPQQALAQVQAGQALLIDVREAHEIAAQAYGVKEQIQIPLASLESRMAELPKDKALILACRSGVRSHRAAAVLMQHGYTEVANLSGGIINWQANGMPVQ